MGLLSIMKRDMRKLLTKKEIERRLMGIMSWWIKNKLELTKDGCPKDWVVAKEEKQGKLVKKKKT